MNEMVKEYRRKYARLNVPEDVEFNWETMENYLDMIDSKGVGFNVASFVGHGLIRENVMGYENRKPKEEELNEMKRLIAEAMDHGAYGMSSGLIYPPSVYADTEELIELAKTVYEFGGIYASHIRGEGATLFEAINEAIEISEKSGAPAHLAHFKASGKPYWGKTEQALKLVEDARERGVDVTFDQYPYIASSTGLTSLLPHWAHEGGAERLIERLRDPKTREMIRKEEQITRDWSTVLIVNLDNNLNYIGKTIKDISENENRDPFNVMCDLLIDEKTRISIVVFGMDENDVRRVMKNPVGMVGSDGSAVSPEGILGQGKPHPRFYGTFPRVIGYYVREGVISLPEAVRKMTSAPAQRLGIRDRGLIKEGFKADITIFDKDQVIDNATFTDPHNYPSGIFYVMVNGSLVIENGEHTGKLPGKALRHKL
jgi:N-acyl-D-amino-acid deacylase